MLARLRDRTTFSNVISLIALFVALGGSAYAIGVGSIGSREIRNNSVSSADVRDETLTGRDVARDSLKGADIDEATLRPAPVGARGPSGPAGPTGAQGKDGAACLPSNPACVGPKGEPGPGGSSAYAYIYNTFAQAVVAGGAVAFGSNGVLKGIIHIGATGGSVVTSAGDYAVSFYLSTTAASQFALTINGLTAPGATYAAGGTENTGQTIISMVAGDVVELRNNTLTTTLLSIAPVNASLRMIKLN